MLPVEADAIYRATGSRGGQNETCDHIRNPERNASNMFCVASLCQYEEKYYEGKNEINIYGQC